MNKSHHSIQVLQRADALMDVLRVRKDAVSLTELSREVGLNKTTALNILATLVELGYASVTEDSRRYRLGPRLLELGSAFEASFEIADIAKPALVGVRDATGETASLHVRVGWERTCVAQVTSLQPIRRVVDLGRTRPLYSGTAAFVLLSDLSDQQIAQYLSRVEVTAFTPHTLTDPAEILAAVRATRSNGYAAVFEDTEPGASAVGVPIRNHAGQVRAALVASGPSARFDRVAIEAALPAMYKWAADVSGQLGWPSHKNRPTIPTAS